jgi:NDP-sugar pyrophosphorylase family protein
MTRIVNIMPMAGLGKRFIDNSYKLPKPLIPINKKPMFIQAAKSMPKSTLNIFICNKNLLNKFPIKDILKKEYKRNFKIITVKRTTKGQANTCLLADKLLKKNDKIFIHSCDSLIRYGKIDLYKKITNSDAVVLTTKPNKAHLKNISSYGWVNINKDEIKKITCKKKASLKPNKDYVIIGSFAFKNKKIFTSTIKNLFRSKKTINNEYYMDMVFSHALDNNYKISNFLVKSYISWGTPRELNNWRKRNARV